MKSLSQELSNFIVSAQFGDLPEEVVHETKRILLDSMGCALGGLTTAQGKIAVKLAKRRGGPPESTIIGIGDRVSCFGAGFANGELIYALDYDAILFPSHITPYVMVAPFALAEIAGASGKDLILAVALGTEISTRLARAILTPPTHGFGFNVFGGTASACKIIKLDAERMAHALGIAGHLCPVPGQEKWRNMPPPSSTAKYASAGWMAEVEITSALLAEMGYLGDTTVLDGDYGFWKMFGSKKWEPERLTERLGQQWRLLETVYKPYPCCGIIHTPLDCFIKIIDDNNLMPDDIEKVRALGEPNWGLPMWNNRQMKTQADAQFSLPYALAVVAHRVRIGADWQSMDTITDPKILKFMEKVSVGVHPEFAQSAAKDFRTKAVKSVLTRVEVDAKGKTFKEERRYSRWDSVPEDARAKDEELVVKFRSNASTALTWDKIDKAVECILNLEKVENMPQLLQVVTM